MECGEIEFDRILQSHIVSENSSLDLGFTRFYWKEILECVAAVHKHGVVHSDLKPANFLLVRGCLKLTDFGIAATIHENRMNVYREGQVGTPKYIAPETLLDSGIHGISPTKGRRTMRFGKTSDVWSLGCIMYRMVYRNPPFRHIHGTLKKAMAITDPNHSI